MDSMDILKRTLSWSSGRPAWQRDALRRLVTGGDLSDDDFKALTELCKARHGLAEGPEAIPLAEEHLAGGEAGGATVNLASITHHEGVNALAEEQTISFAPGLTVVYGDNAAGKSGYTRILKTACRARGAEEILGNILIDSAPPKPSSSIRFRIGADGPEEVWPDKTENGALLGKVSVFDSHCAAVYLREKTDVAFRPFGLDLYDKLSNACEAIKKRLERERNLLAAGEKPMPEVPEGTATHTQLSRLSSLTNPDAITKLGTLSAQERERLRLLRGRLDDLKAKDPAKAASGLELRARRLTSLTRHIEQIDDALAQDKLEQLFAAQERMSQNEKEAQRLRTETFSDELLSGTGTEAWMNLWEAAKKFSEEHAYRDQAFPVTEKEARCVLCQQDLDAAGTARLRQFQEFMVSKAEEELRAARTAFGARQDVIKALKVEADDTKAAIDELRLESKELASAVDAAFTAAESRHKSALKAIEDKSGLPANLEQPDFGKDKVETLVTELTERATELRKSIDPAVKEQLEKDYNELAARVIVGKSAELIKGEIERKKKIAAYQLCIDDTGTYHITRQSTALTKEAVTKQLRNAFTGELEKLRFRHVEVELQEAGGERGSLYHKLILKRAPAMSVPKVLSEGEARCLSIAAFFAELITADDPSAILFDDPVSSLDHKWRNAVATRLVEEAKTRQVIVFTHDLVFLLALHRFAEKTGVSVHDQRLRRDRRGTGVCDSELPWDAMKVSKRIGVLNKEYQAAESLFRDGEQIRYEREAIHIYGLLRETWERAFEEVLLGGTVERYRPSIQTQQVRSISDITEQDCTELDAGMEKSSKWLAGHDLAPAEHEDVPEPDELRADIDAIIAWVDRIRKRRR